MEAADVSRACQHARGLVLGRYPEATARAHVNEPCHLLYMLDEIPAFMAAGRREKAMRWLGFVQGALWYGRYTTIEHIKIVNRPTADAE